MESAHCLKWHLFLVANFLSGVGEHQYKKFFLSLPYSRTPKGISLSISNFSVLALLVLGPDNSVGSEPILGLRQAQQHRSLLLANPVVRIRNACRHGPMSPGSKATQGESHPAEDKFTFSCYLCLSCPWQCLAHNQASVHLWWIKITCLNGFLLLELSNITQLICIALTVFSSQQNTKRVFLGT